MDELSQDIQIFNTTVVIPLRKSVELLNQSVSALIADDTARTVLLNLVKQLVFLEKENARLAQTEAELANLLNPVQVQNNALRNQLTGLESVATVLTGTTNVLSGQVQQTAHQVKIKIEENRVLGVARSMVSAQDPLVSWDCGASDLFPSFFGNPDTIAMNLNTLRSVLSTVQPILLDPLCLDRTNLEQYLRQEYNVNVNGITANQLVQGVDDYVDLALEYLYPSSASSIQNGAITADQWEQASYQCSNLPTFLY